MSTVFKDERGIIPRWRSFAVANETGELKVVQSEKIILPFQSKLFIEEQERAWRSNRDLFHAGDLISSAYAIGVESEFADVAKFIIETDHHEISPLRTLAGKILGLAEEGVIGLVQPENASIRSALDHQKYFGDIRRYKSYLRREPQNPIAWVELGRLYVLVGSVEKARRCIDAALHLDHNNRFIVRSASRFYSHFNPKDDKALQIVKQAEFVKSDPWLLSAEIAYSTALKRHSKLAKIGANMVTREKSNYFSVTELSSALGTMELTNGTAKEAKYFFKTSLIQPNDNSVAQASFRATDLLGIDIKLSEKELPLAFEAQAQLAYKHRKYEDAYLHALEWLADEPFSHRPIWFAAHMSYTFLDKREHAIDLLKKGLKVNPNNSTLNNNLCYYLLKSDRTSEATEVFKSQLEPHIKEDPEIDTYTIIATAGLLEYRTGHPDSGKAFYQKAIDVVKNQKKSSFLLALATANYIEEELRVISDHVKILQLKFQLESVCKNSDEDQIEVMYAKLCKEIDRKMKQEP